MDAPPIASKLLALQPVPEVAKALRERKDRIIRLWQETVKDKLPEADPLTHAQVRDSIPAVVDYLAGALEASDPEPTKLLAEVTQEHGRVRFTEKYDLEQFIVEYRLLRQIAITEVGDALGGSFTVRQAAALDAGLDIALQQGTLDFVRQLANKLRVAAEVELKFLSFLYHDLRNNLNGMMLNLQLIADAVRRRDGMQKEASDIAGMNRMMAKTIEGMERLLHAERLKKQSARPNCSPFSPRALAEELVARAATSAKEKGLALSLDVPVDGELKTDGEIVTLVLQNLLGNATKYSDKGTVTIRARPPAGGDGWTFAVSDEGEGIAPEQRERIFESFARGETYGQDGIGLGLAIASQGAKLLGAKLTVDSEPGRGSTFSLVFPPEGCSHLLEPPRAP